MYVASGDDLTERTHELGHHLTEQLEGLQLLPHHRPRPGEVATWYPAHLGGHAPTRQRARVLDEVPFSRGHADVGARSRRLRVKVPIGSTNTFSRLDTGRQARKIASATAHPVVSTSENGQWSAAQGL